MKVAEIWMREMNKKKKKPNVYILNDVISMIINVQVNSK